MFTLVLVEHLEVDPAKSKGRLTMNVPAGRTGSRCTILAALAVSVTGLQSSLAQKVTVSSGLLLTDVTVVDTRSGKEMPHMSVAIDGGKIVHIGRAGTLLAKAPARSVDAHGKFVVPGYWEMHGHPIDSPDRADNLTLMLANGITGVRQMSGSDELLKQRRDGTLMPAADAPELLAMPGSILLRGNAGTVPMAVAEVDKQKAEGADFIKTIDVTPPVFFAALNEATKQGLLYDGHLSPGVDAVKASEAGMRVMEHLGPMETILLSCSTDEAAIRQAMAARAAAAAQAPAPPPAMALTKAATSDPVLMRQLADPNALKRTQHIIDTFSEAKCRQVAQTFASHRTWQVPTLIRLRTSEFGDDPVYRDNPNLRYVGPATRQLWDQVSQKFSATMGPQDRADPETDVCATTQACQTLWRRRRAPAGGLGLWRHLAGRGLFAASGIRSARRGRIHTATSATDDDARRSEAAGPRGPGGQRG